GGGDGMTHWRGALVSFLALVVIAVGCAGPAAPAPTTAASEAPRPVAAPKRITIAIQGDPVAVMPVAELGGASVPGTEPLRDVLYDLVDTVEAVDQRTIMVRWKSPFIEADTMFSGGRAVPLPKHLLEKPYLEQKATMMQLPYWSDGYVGNGPFKLRDWTRGS